MSNRVPPSIRYVVFHRPGPIWQYGVDFREQEGVKEHIEHYLKFHQPGKIELGGPFLLQDAGGIMVATKDVYRMSLNRLLQPTPPSYRACFFMKSAHGSQPWSINEMRYS